MEAASADDKARQSKHQGQVGQGATPIQTGNETKTKAQLKAERKAQFEAQRAAAMSDDNKKLSNKNKAAQSDSASGSKSKAQLKAERRAQQEAQRALKVAKVAEEQKRPAVKSGDGVHKKPDTGTSGQQRVPDSIKLDDDKTARKIAKKLEKQQIPQRQSLQRKVRLFSHLQQYERNVSLTKDLPFTEGAIHPAILKLGVQYDAGVICGSNARCIALLLALKKVISDYSTPPHKELSRDLEARIKPCISFLSQCRPMSVSMGNAVKYIKYHISHVASDMTDDEAKELLINSIDTFLREKILLAGEAISKTYACKKIEDKDVIMVYSCSSLISRVLCDAHDMGKKFRVVVVDARPKVEGRELLRRLIGHGIKCSYVLINSACYVMREVTKVILGAHALLANGYVMSRVGTAQLALIARAHNVPVLICCETYKFQDRVHTDSFVFNELGDPSDLVLPNNSSFLHNWQNTSSLGLLNLVYDVTPPELVSMVITEIGMIPCTSVPVVLRVKHVETDMSDM